MRMVEGSDGSVSVFKVGIVFLVFFKICSVFQNIAISVSVYYFALFWDCDRDKTFFVSQYGSGSSLTTFT